MQKGRLEAFSDGVMAILITIMVLELKAPHNPDGAHLAQLKPLVNVFLSYILSFVYLGIYWSNHHHMLHAVKRVTGGVLWANLHLLFWLSLIPFTTAWMGENNFAPDTLAVYGFNLLMSALSWWILQRVLVAAQGDADHTLARAFGRDLKGNLSNVLYVLGIAAAYWQPWLSGAMYIAVALMWLIPDRRIERELIHEPHG